MNNERIEKILAANKGDIDIRRACLTALGRRGGDQAAAIKALEELPTYNLGEVKLTIGGLEPDPKARLHELLGRDKPATKAELVTAAEAAGLRVAKLKKPDVIEAVKAFLKND